MDTIKYNLLSAHKIAGFVRDIKDHGSPQALRNLLGDRTPPDALAFRFGVANFHYIMNPNWFLDVFKNVEVFEKPPSVVKYVSLHGKQGIFTSANELWKQQRSILKPHFMKAALAGHEESVKLETSALVSKWAADHGTKDLYEDLRDFSLKILFRTVFQHDTKERFNELKESIDVLNGFLFKSLLNPMTFLFKVYFSPSEEVKEAKSVLDSIVDDVCRPHYDAFHAGILTSEILNSAGYYSAMTPEAKQEAKMQASDEIWQLISAGYEATASSLAWAIAELANHPKYQDKVREEIKLTIGDDALTLQNSAQLKYQSNYLTEISRLYPTLHTTVPRKATQDAVIGDGYKIKKGDIVVVPLINVQQDPRWFKDPMTLNPDRDDRATSQESKYAYMPFLMGPHVCVGKSMFLQQAMAAITETLRQGVVSLAGPMPDKIYKTTILPSTNCGMVYTPIEKAEKTEVVSPSAAIAAAAPVSRCPFHHS